jgi:hypothetical protein
VAQGRPHFCGVAFPSRINAFLNIRFAHSRATFSYLSDFFTSASKKFAGDEKNYQARLRALDRFPHGWYNARASGAQAGAENNPEAGTSPAAD